MNIQTMNLTPTSPLHVLSCPPRLLPWLSPPPLYANRPMLRSGKKKQEEENEQATTRETQKEKKRKKKRDDSRITPNPCHAVIFSMPTSLVDSLSVPASRFLAWFDDVILIPSQCFAEWCFLFQMTNKKPIPTTPIIHITRRPKGTQKKAHHVLLGVRFPYIPVPHSGRRKGFRPSVGSCILGLFCVMQCLSSCVCPPCFLSSRFVDLVILVTKDGHDTNDEREGKMGPSPLRCFFFFFLGCLSAPSVGAL
jgi:hypothetical protein